MNPLVIGLTKVAVNTVSSLGVGTVVNNAVRMTTPEKVSKLAKVGIIVGGFFLSSMVGDKIGTYAEEEIDKLVKIIKSIRSIKVETIAIKKEDNNETRIATAADE